MATQIRRREFVATLGSAAVAWPLAARAQQAAMPVAGILNSSGDKWVTSFRKGLSEEGQIEGRNVAIELRSMEQYGEVPSLAAELVQRRVAVIAALGGPAAAAAKATTATIPIVFSIGGDPVELGLVPNINRPGGNITGVTFFAKQLLQKQVGILHDLVPKASVLGLLINPNNWRHQADAGEVQAAAQPRLASPCMLRTPAARVTSTLHLRDLSNAMRRRSSSRAMRFSSGSATNSWRWRNNTRWLPSLDRANLSMPAALMSYAASLADAASSGRHLCWPHPQGGEARRFAGHATEQIRAGDQSQDR